MNPDDSIFSWKSSRREKKVAADLAALAAQTKTPPTYATGGYTSSVNQASLYNEILRQMNRSISASLYGTGPGLTQASSDVKFSGKEFAVSTAKGARSFKIDSLGRLTGIHFPQVWTPGENLAECKAAEKHTEGKFPDCKCGFYGYYDGSNDYYVTGLVSAVVEGYGEAVLGSQGFRVTKAKILALSIDSSVKSKTAYLVRRNYSNVPMFDSFSQLISEFPTDYGLGAPAVDEPDFWTRDAS